VLRDTLAMLDRELGHADMGAAPMAQRLADIVLIQALRAYVTEHGAGAFRTSSGEALARGEGHRQSLALQAALYDLALLLTYAPCPSSALR
jgi:hypothetical protein